MLGACLGLLAFCSCIPGFPVILWLGCPLFFFFLTSPEFVSSWPSSGFPMYLPNIPSLGIDSFYFPLIALNNVSQILKLEQNRVVSIRCLQSPQENQATRGSAPGTVCTPPSMVTSLRYFSSLSSPSKGDVFFDRDLWT